MTDDSELLDRFVDGDSRRSFIKKGVLATAGTGMAASGITSAQEGTDDGERDAALQEQDEALMFTSQVRPGANFVITSPVLQWTPKVEAVSDNIWGDYNTRMIRYLNTGERVQFFQAEDAEVPNFDQQAGYVVDAEGDTAENSDTPQPEVFDLDPEPALFSDSPFLMNVHFSPVGEDEEDDLLEDEDWWLDDENGGDDGDGGGDQ